MCFCWLCKRLTEVKMGNNLKTIGERVFSDCSSLKNIKIHGNVETIGNGAFEGCTSLLSVYSDCKKNAVVRKGSFCRLQQKMLCSYSSARHILQLLAFVMG